MFLDPKNAKASQKSVLLSPLIQSSGCLSLSFHYVPPWPSPGAGFTAYASVLGENGSVNGIHTVLKLFPRGWADEKWGHPPGSGKSDTGKMIPWGGIWQWGRHGLLEKQILNQESERTGCAENLLQVFPRLLILLGFPPS